MFLLRIDDLEKLYPEHCARIGIVYIRHKILVESAYDLVNTTLGFVINICQTLA